MAAMTVVGLNICTGNPLLALWVGSRVVGGGTLTMGAVGSVRTHVPWLRSMRSERVEYERGRSGLTGMEMVLIAMVVLSVAAFEVWFFFFSTSPIDQRSGR